jgi:ribosomal protein S27AE
MNETCDRCGPAVRAAYRADRDGELYLCGHCTSRLWKALSAQGWTIWPVSGYALAPQLTWQLRPAVPEHRGFYL